MSDVTIENLNVQSDREETRVVLLTGNRKEEQQEKTQRVNVMGVITTPSDWWSIHESNIEKKHARIDYSYEKGRIKLIINQHLASQESAIAGNLEYTTILQEFGLNSKRWDVYRLADFIRFNVRYFDSREEAMSLHAKLTGFSGKVKREIEKHKDDKGNEREIFRQVVETELPDFIQLSLPIFKGIDERSTFSAYLEVKSSDSGFTVKLLAPDLAEITEKLIEKTFDPILELFIGKIPVIRLD